MASRFRVAVAVGMAVVCCALVLAEGGDVHRVLNAKYAQFDRAMKARNVKRMVAIGDSDLKVREKDGRVLSRQQFVTQTEQSFEHVTFSSVKTRILSVTVKGNEAIAKVRTVAPGSMVVPPDATKHKLRYDVTMENTWDKTAHGWTLKLIRVLDEHTKLD